MVDVPAAFLAGTVRTPINCWRRASMVIGPLGVKSDAATVLRGSAAGVLDIDAGERLTRISMTPAPSARSTTPRAANSSNVRFIVIDLLVRAYAWSCRR